MSSATTGILARLLNAGLGIWLMAAPAVLGYGAPASTSDRLVGPIAASLAIIAVWEIVRPLRHANTALGAWLIVAPLILGYAITPAINSVIVGAAMVALSRVRGEVRGRYGGGWRAIRDGSR
ncbi:MAG: SPW repeat protein, partial [Gemmatimonadota bacterium]